MCTSSFDGQLHLFISDRHSSIQQQYWRFCDAHSSRYQALSPRVELTLLSAAVPPYEGPSPELKLTLPTPGTKGAALLSRLLLAFEYSSSISSLVGSFGDPSALSIALHVAASAVAHRQVLCVWCFESRRIFISTRGKGVREIVPEPADKLCVIPGNQGGAWHVLSLSSDPSQPQHSGRHAKMGMSDKDRASTLIVGAVAGALALSLFNKARSSVRTSPLKDDTPAAAARPVS